MVGKYVTEVKNGGVMNKTQRNLVIEIKGSYVNETGSIWEAADVVRTTTFPSQSVSTDASNYLPWFATRQSINNQYPVLAFVDESLFSNSGHFYVIKGYSANGQIKINDSWIGGEYECSWNGFTTGYWEGETTREYLCSVYYKDYNK